LNASCPNCGRLNRPGARYCASCQTPLSATAARLQPGQLLDGGTYRVVRALGKGGMGAVWLVAQTKAFDRLAVVKEVIDYFDPADAEAQQKAVQRFEAEARTLGDLKHPGIPDLYAYFSESGHNYLVMEYIEGPDLRQGLTHEDSATGQLRSGGPLPDDQVLRYAIEICKVLEYLERHQPTVVHNDIKPGNIIIDFHSGRAVLVDFGTAKTRYLQAGGRPDRGKASIYGTVGYAAPELYRGQSEPRSDVYSLAATAYHLLTDDDPRDHPFQYPQLETLSVRLADILRKALAHEIDARLTATQFRQQLEGYLAGQTAPLHALPFPDGDAADSRAELLALAVKHWRYASGILQDGTLVRWLRGTLHDAEAAQAAEAAVDQWPASPDAALDAFLRQLDPAALPPGKMELRTTSLRLPGVGVGQQLREEIEIANRGRGYLRGEILSSRPWVNVGKGTFSCPPGQVVKVPLKIDTTGLEPHQAHLAAVTLTPAGGLPEVLPVQITVIAPAIRVVPTEVDLGTVSRGELSTARRSVSVTNVSRAVAECRILGAAEWLLVKPEAFRLQPGGQQHVELVGRVAKARGRKQKVALAVVVDGGENQRIEVRLRVKGGLLG
jgi:tRNA A-37 threonylcarbamoyl transferase component Bud32